MGSLTSLEDKSKHKRLDGKIKVNKEPQEQKKLKNTIESKKISTE